MITTKNPAMQITCIRSPINSSAQTGARTGSSMVTKLARREGVYRIPRENRYQATVPVIRLNASTAKISLPVE